METLCGTISRLISQFTRPIMFLTPTPRPISLRWSFSLNSNLRKHPIHSVTQRTPQAKNFHFENDSEVSQLNRGQLCSYAAAHAGSQFRVHTFTLSICGRSARFIRWDRSGATVTRSFDYINNRISLPTFSGVTHISIIASADTTLPSHQHRRRISNRSSMSKNVCGKTILPIVNSV
jgi:hypothetical protein